MELTARAEPYKLALVISHDDGMRITSSNLDRFVLVKTATLQLQLPRRQLTIIVTMTQLPVHVPPPSVNFPERRPGNSMPKPTLNRINSLTSFLKTRHQLGYIIGIHMPQSQLPVLVIPPHSVYQALRADEKTEVVPA